MAKQIVKVELSSGASRHHEHIEWVWYADSSALGRTPEKRETVANNIRRGESYYYTRGGGQRAEVEAYERNGVWFIRTKGDSTTADNLLSLT